MLEPLVYIPSYNRDTLLSIDNLHGTAILERVALVVHPSEIGRYQKHGVRIIPCPVQGELGRVRRWLMDHHEGRYMVQMDDDLRFAVRRDDDPTKFRIAKPDDIDTMFERVFQLLREVPLVGVRQRGGANRSTPPMELTVRQCMFHGIDNEIAKREGFAYKSCVFEDFDYTLQVLTRGYQNAVLTTHTIDQAESNAPGGVAGYRNNDRMERDALDLALDFPGFVKVVQKAGWRGMDTRTDVTVQWKKALASAGETLTDVDVQAYDAQWALL
jgi:hypothetical protein